MAYRIFISDDDMCTTQKLNLARVQKWFIANGCSIVLRPQDADRVLAVTCNGWALLEENSYARINELKNGHSEKLIVVGCVVDAHPEKLQEIWSGPTVRTRSSAPLSFEQITDLFPEFDIPLIEIPAQSEFRRPEDYRDSSVNRQFINISEGCSFACSFCTHKPGLGPRRSRPLDEILKQVEKLDTSKVKIVHLMGMETGLWGLEFGLGYPDLLEALLNRNYPWEYHVAQFQPHGLKLHKQRLVELFSQRQITDIQMPIQSTSDRIMKMMNRKNHAAEISPFLQQIRERNPRVVLRTDLIVGWPTETPEERRVSLEYAANHFDEVAVYCIELHPDLPAWKYKDLAYSSQELEEIVRDSRAFLKQRGVLAHSGQQDDASMSQAEKDRIELRNSRSSLTDQNKLFIPVSDIKISPANS